MVISPTYRLFPDPARSLSLRALPGCLLLVALLSTVASGATDDEEDRPAFWLLAERLIETHDLQRPADEVLDHMAGVLSRRDELTGVFSRVERAITSPWTPPSLAAELRELLAAPAVATKGERFAALWDGLADWMDLGPHAADGDGDDDAEGEEDDDAAAAERTAHTAALLTALDEQWNVVADPDLAGLPLLDELSELMGRAHDTLTAALAGLSDKQRELLFACPLSFREGWYQSHFPDAEPTYKEKRRVSEVVEELLMLPLHDRAAALEVAGVLTRLTEPAFIKTLGKRLKGIKGTGKPPAGFGKDIVTVVGEVPSRRVVLGGRRASSYEAPAALIIDIGGKDVYERAAVVDSAEMLASVVLDLDGNDRYESEGPGAAVATGGVALLFDAEGNDRYACGRLGQAAATLGVALLIDLEGKDSYRAEDYAQAHAVNGVALLYDIEGDDEYEAWAFAQGGGLGNGFCALVDGDGNDTYLADGHWPDVYGNSGPDIFHGASQGYATGMRPEVPGGIAALLDLGDGKDRYQAGNFAMGGGYYFSFGLMYDGGGDDENHGSRYSQGFGVHQAAGVRWDAGGNDSYSCRSVAHTGMAWDEGVGYLLDDEGNDSYRVGDLGCGGAAQTGVAVLIDLDGKDRYQTGKESQGGTGASEYHDKPALALLIDLGGDKDSYTAAGREDNEVHTSPGVELFLDSKAKTLEKALGNLR